jgi:hypothetical protein
VAYRVPSGTAEAIYIGALSDDVVAFARARDGSVEIATSEQTWRGDDHVLVASLRSESEVTRMLEELVREAGRRPSDEPGRPHV